MNKNQLVSVTLLILFFLLSGTIHLSRKDCRLHLDKTFISDEQEYIAEFNQEGKAFFHSTFYRNTTYRIIVCREQEGFVKYTISDHQENLIFSNEEYNYTPYWNFLFENTVDCIITVEKLDNNVSNNQATATLLIGFRK
jgi:hypothetical protein